MEKHVSCGEEVPSSDNNKKMKLELAERVPPATGALPYFPLGLLHCSRRLAMIVSGIAAMRKFPSAVAPALKN